MKIAIDARFYGLENAGLGRYTINLLNELQKIDSSNQYFILLRKKYFNELKLNDNFKKVLADFSHYGFNEQIKLPWVIKSLKVDLVHFLHFNVPVVFRDRYIVTVHDLLMHKQKGLEATTLTPSRYFIKRLAYKFVFANAVKRALRIIVPSQAVKDEVAYYYKIDPDKIIVTYEGV